MFNLLLALITGLVIGWNFHSFFLKLTPPNILKTDINFTKLKNEKITPIQTIPQTTPKKENTQNIKSIEEIKKSIEMLKEKQEKILNKEKNINTPTTLKKSLTKKTDNFYDLLHHDLFSDAMSLYVDASEAKLLLYQPILMEYLELKVDNNPQEAVEQILEFQELEPSHKKINMEILYEIEDSNYSEKAKLLLSLIKEKLAKKKEYDHELPLKKVGEHFTLEVTINNEPITLLLDTGATLTMVNEDKFSSPLTVINENILLKTAGGQINAQLQEADTFTVGDIELEKFQIVASSFKQKDADGLLGMNFFKKFKFKIDQEKGILYLSKKE